jgi:hypothetical protein
LLSRPLILRTGRFYVIDAAADHVERFLNLLFGVVDGEESFGSL